MTNVRHVLIVDDSATARMFLARTLQAAWPEAELTVTEAKHGKDALEKLKQMPEPPDLIVSDQNMPVMNGLQFVQRIACSPRLHGIPVIVVTSSASPQLIADLERAGVAAVLEKPITAPRLRQQIQTIPNLIPDETPNQEDEGLW